MVTFSDTQLVRLLRKLFEANQSFLTFHHSAQVVVRMVGKEVQFAFWTCVYFIAALLRQLWTVVKGALGWVGF